MSSVTTLELWVQSQYYTQGFNSKGEFIGKKAFKARLISTYPAGNCSKALKADIRRLVNRGAYKPEQRTVDFLQDPQPDTSSAISGPADLGSGNSVHAFGQHQPSNSGESYIIEDGNTSAQPPEVVEANDLITETSNEISQVHASLNPKLQELRVFTETLVEQNRDQEHRLPTLEDQKYLLDSNDESGHPEEAISSDNIRDAIIFSANVLKTSDQSLFPQYSLLGECRLAGQSPFWPASEKDRRLFHNTNIPFSTFICGLQGSGKSHTLSCLLENCLLPTPVLGKLQRPLSALVLNFGQYSSRMTFMPSETAFLAYPNPMFPRIPCVTPINILVAPSNYHNLKSSYEQIPGVNVHPFRLRSCDLNVGSMLNLMSVDQSQSAPLYIGQITKILRELASSSPDGFNYGEFKRRLEMSHLTRSQQGPLRQRLDLLESFLVTDDSAPSWTFESGGVTIVDLSCPFVDANMACMLFNIGIRLYLESGLTTGKVIAIDEAHKYMTDTPASKALTESLLSIIRQQRHFGARVIISSQEPTISPRLMDLCSTTIIHRFTSPEWFGVLRRHISLGEDQKKSDELFRRILELRVGEALLFAPSALLHRTDDGGPERLGSDPLQMKIRKRVTWDGGRSIVCI